MVVSTYEKSLNIEKNSLSEDYEKKIEQQKLDYDQKIENEKLEYIKKIENEKLEYTKKIEQQKLDYANKNKEQKIIIGKQEIVIKDQKDLISSKNIEINEANQAKEILEKKLIDLEIENKKFSKLINDNKLNKEDQNLIAGYKKENILLAKEIIKLQNEIESTNSISKNIDLEKLRLNDELELISNSNKNLSVELALVNSQIKEYEEIMSAVGENDFFQKAKNLLGLGVDQEIIVNQLKNNNELLSKKNIELKTRLDEVLSLSNEMNTETTNLSNEIKKNKEDYAKSKTENNKLIEEKQKISNELEQTKLNFKEANLKIASQINEMGILKNELIKLNNENNKEPKLTSQKTKELNLVVTNERVNLREIPKIPSKIKYIIDSDKKLKLINESDEWVEVLTESNVKGFIFKKYIDFDIKKEDNDIKKITSKKTINTPKPDLLLTVKVYSNLVRGDGLSVSKDANIRESASTLSEIVKIVKKGEIVFFDFVLRGWVKVITLSQDVGYIDSKYLHIVN